jgi:hypothetical protein
VSNVRGCLLSCDHEVLWARDWQPSKGERIWCFRCQDMRVVVASPDSFVAGCLTMGCRFYVVREKPESIRRQVARHLTSHPSHVVRVTNRGTGERVLIRAGDSQDYGREGEARLF